MWTTALSLVAPFIPRRSAGRTDLQTLMSATQAPHDGQMVSADWLFAESLHRSRVETDRLFAVLMVINWVAGIILALVVSPRTWIGDESKTHVHVWAAV